MKMGDKVIYAWMVGVYDKASAYTVVDESVSKREWDFKIQSPSGMVFPVREGDVYVVQTAERIKSNDKASSV